MCKQCYDAKILELFPTLEPGEKIGMTPDARQGLIDHAKKEMIRFGDAWTCRVHHKVYDKALGAVKELGIVIPASVERAMEAERAKTARVITDVFPNRAVRRASKAVR